MPRGPKGERRPADVIATIKVMRIATGEESEHTGRLSAKKPQCAHNK